MGFEPKRKTYKLIFDDEEMNGLVVRCHSLPMGDLIALMRLTDIKGDEVSSEQGQLPFRKFADSLVEWNVTHNGEPVPPTFEGVMSQDLDFINVVIGAWMKNVAGIPGPLAQSSTNGSRFPVDLLPMEALSPSL
jgi:hypothetical protein